MKNVQFLAVPLLLAMANPALAQTKTDKAHVQWGADQTDKENGKFNMVIGDMDNSSYLLVQRKDKWFVQRMDGVKTAWQKPIDSELDKHDLNVHTLLVMQDEILVFTQMYDKKDNENRLFVSTYARADFSPRKRFERVAVIPAEKSSNIGQFSISASPDRSKVLVQVFPPKQKDGDEQSHISIYEASMEQPLWSQDFKLPYGDMEFKAETQRVDNDGSVIVLGVKYAAKQEKRDLKRANKSTYEYHLLVYSGDSPTPQDNPITVSDKFLQDMTLSMGKDGDIICAGLYGNKNSFNVGGAFFLRLDRATKQVTHSSFKDFSDDFITMYMSEKQAEKAKKKADRKGEELEMPEYTLHDIIRREDGGAVLLAEQYYVVVSTYTYSTGNGGTATQTIYNYYYNDVLVINIDPEGNIEWANKVPKHQVTSNDGGMYSSFAVDVKGSNIYLVFNDTGENLFLKPGDKVKQFSLTGKDALVVLATIDSEGNTTREALFSPERRDVILRPKDCVELKDENMFIYASRKKDYRYGLIEFK
ncbi:MAG: hypothetical protein JST38_07290 [Bacteroidetes bacterium]|nr:hypothetical protein [Bacteroidota bacterium]MBS1940661.1 hypothetical protein [Bacteroidota bacterium]